MKSALYDLNAAALHPLQEGWTKCYLKDDLSNWDTATMYIYTFEIYFTLKLWLGTQILLKFYLIHLRSFVWEIIFHKSSVAYLSDISDFFKAKLPKLVFMLSRVNLI